MTATVNCLKAFGEQIKITVTSRANAYAKAECILDYARRIVDTALYHEELDKNILEFGSDEVLIDMVVPDFEGFKAGMSDGTIWAGGYYQMFMGNHQLTPEDETDPLAEWADEDVSRTYKFSDYTIKDCMSEENKKYVPYTTEQKKEYAKQFTPNEIKSYRKGQRSAYAHMGNIGRRNSFFIYDNLKKNEAAAPPAAPPKPAAKKSTKGK